MRTQSLTKSLTAASGNNICTSQTPGGAGDLTINGQTNNIFLSQTPASGAGVFILNGLLAFAGQIVLDVARTLSFTSGGNFSAATITVLGTSDAGLSQSEAIAGPNVGTVSTTKTFKTISAIQFSSSPGGVAVTGFTNVAVLDSQRVVGITSAGNDSGRIFTVYGTDDRGLPISESLAGPNVSTVSTQLNFKTVTRVAIDGAAAGAITVGTTSVGSSVPVVLDQYVDPFSASVEVDVTGTLNYDVQYTYGDVFDAAALAGLVWWSITPLAGQTADKDGTLTAPVRAVRLKINSGTGSGKFTVMQAGLGN